MKLVAGSALVLLSLLSSIQAIPRPSLKQTPITLPSNNPISNKFSSWLSAVNTADKDTISDFYSTSYIARPSEDGENCEARTWASAAQLARFANLTGGFELVELESNPDDTTITVLLRQRTDVSEYDFSEYYFSE